MEPRTTCPKCAREIPLVDVNVSTDIALCRRCNQVWSFSDLLVDEQIVLPPPGFAPGGTWLRDSGPGDFEVGASTRSAAALVMVPFMCVWSGGSLGGIYGSQIYHGKFELLPSLFGLPFLIGTFFLGGVTLMSICGQRVVKVRGDEGVIFTGVGAVGLRKRFDWRRVTGIRITEIPSGRGVLSRQITLEGEKSIEFGSSLSKERLDFVFGVLRRKWRESGGGAR